MNRTRFLIVLVFLFVPFFAFCQKGVEQNAVKAVIANLFKAMQTGDSTLARNCFAKEVTTATIYKDKSGKPAIRIDEDVNGFVRAIGSPRKEVWYEEIWGLKISVDGELAQAWCDYAFYVDKNLSHCGVDAFHLFKDNGTWKIFHIADTRKKTDCKIPKEITDKHK